MTKKAYNGWNVGSFITIVGIIIDWGTGAIHTVEPSEIHADLIRINPQD